jgi:hypothetical protein
MGSLSADKRVEIIAHLVECNSIRGTSRLCEVDTKTVPAGKAAPVARTEPRIPIAKARPRAKQLSLFPEE